jgi:hypothetical protein
MIDCAFLLFGRDHDMWHDSVPIFDFRSRSEVSSAKGERDVSLERTIEFARGRIAGKQWSRRGAGT